MKALLPDSTRRCLLFCRHFLAVNKHHSCLGKKNIINSLENVNLRLYLSATTILTVSIMPRIGMHSNTHALSHRRIQWWSVFHLSSLLHKKTPPLSLLLYHSSLFPLVSDPNFFLKKILLGILDQPINLNSYCDICIIFFDLFQLKFDFFYTDQRKFCFLILFFVFVLGVYQNFILTLNQDSRLVCTQATICIQIQSPASILQSTRWKMVYVGTIWFKIVLGQLHMVGQHWRCRNWRYLDVVFVVGLRADFICVWSVHQCFVVCHLNQTMPYCISSLKMDMRF